MQSVKLRNSRITPAADECHPRLRKRTSHQWQERLGIADQTGNQVSPTQLERKLSCAQEALDPAHRIGGHVCGTLERIDGNDERSTGASPCSGFNELGRGALIATDHRRCPVPRSPIGLVFEARRQGTVCGQTVSEACRLTNR